jgi:hypothetical protein
MKIDITLNGVKVTKDIPISWDDLTFKQYYDLINFKGDDVDILCYFTGVDPEVFRKAKIEGLESVLSAVSFLHQVPDFSNRPYEFMGVKMPIDITFEALAPYLDARQLISTITKDDLKTFYDLHPKLCAIYVHAVRNDWTGYDGSKAMDLVPEVNEQPAWEVVGLGTFFINKLLTLKTPTKKNSPAGDSPLSKLMQGMRNLTRRLVSFLRSIGSAFTRAYRKMTFWRSGT